MFTKNRMLLAVRFFIILVMLNGTYGVFPIKEHVSVYALGETPGSLDATFDGDGLVTTAIGSFADGANGVAIQADGKILVAGGFSNPGYDDFFVARYTNDGNLDTDFGVDGIVTTDFGDDDGGGQLVVQDDGKIVVLGNTIPSNSDSKIALARYNSDGSLDTSFGSDGKVTTNPGSGYDGAADFAIQPDGKIIVVGTKNVGINDDDILLIRYNSDGSLDTTFDVDGIVNTAIGSGSEFGASIALQQDGKIIVGGTSFDAVTKTDFILLRYNSDGSLDTSFDADGIVIKDFGIGLGYERGGYVALQPDNRIVIAGNNNDGYFLLARFDNDGTLDTNFGTGGLVTSYMDGDTYASVLDIELQSNDKIVVAGYTRFFSGSNSYDFALARYNADGSLDTSFDTDGKVVTDFGTNEDDFGVALAIQTNGNIVVAGSRHIGDSNYDVAMARYIGDVISKIHYVKQNAAGANNGSSWTDAYTDLQSALAVAQNGDEIWVASGTYKPGTARTNTFQLVEGLAVYGGFAGVETTRDQRDPALHLTILSGDIDGNDTNNDGNYINETHTDIQGNNSYTVVMGADNATLDGFSITASSDSAMYNSYSSPTLSNVIFTGNSASSGGGMFNDTSNPTLTNVSFIGNSANSGGGGGMFNDTSNPIMTNVAFIGNSANSGGGGGMYNYSNSKPALTDVTFSTNSAYHGGGMYNITSSPSLTNVTFTGNSADYGGGIASSSSNLSLTNVTFENNSVDYSGGGMFNEANSSLSLVNITFTGNTAFDNGGGLHNYGGGNPTLTNVTFTGNSAGNGGGMYNIYASPILKNITFTDNSANYGGGMYNEYGGATTLVNSILWGNSAPDGPDFYHLYTSPTVTYSIIQGGYLGTGNLDTDPLLGPLADNGGFTQTMALGADSPAVDTGDDTNCPAFDQRGVTRPYGSHCDIGAYEYVPTIPTPTLPPGVVSHARDFSTPFVPPSGSATGLLPIRTKPVQQAQSAVVLTSTPMPEPVLPTSTPQPVFAEVVNPTSTPEPVIAMDAADTTAPETTLIVTPRSTSRQRSAFFAYESTEAGTFVCSLDGSAYFACERSIRFTGLGEGMHLFQVRAVDEAGNYDDTPVVYTWMIERNVDIQRYKMTKK